MRNITIRLKITREPGLSIQDPSDGIIWSTGLKYNLCFNNLNSDRCYVLLGRSDHVNNKSLIEYLHHNMYERCILFINWG